MKKNIRIKTETEFNSGNEIIKLFHQLQKSCDLGIKWKFLVWLGKTPKPSTAPRPIRKKEHK